MKTSVKNYQQQKVTGGEQKVILSEVETGETDELDPKFKENQSNDGSMHNPNIEPGDDPSSELI